MSSGVDTLPNESAISTERLQLAQFLSILWPSGFGEQWCLFWGAPSKRSMWVQTLSEDVLDRLMVWAESENVYIGCGLRAQNFGPNQRGDRDAVSAIPGLWIDLDYVGDQHKKTNLPRSQDEALALLQELGLPPTLVVNSGHGLQAWWVFKEPWTLDSDDERTKAERLTKGWCTTLRAKAKAHGWDADQVGDLPRVMRLPGLWNRKGVPKRSHTLRCTAASTYNPNEFETYLSTELAPHDSMPNLTWIFTLDPVNAQPPADKFAALLDQDFLFKTSWIHARTDIQNQSLSSYDMSLATRAFAAGWSEQEVVNLLIAHRRKYKDKTDHPEKIARRDYYERTLTRAISGIDQEARTEAIEALKAGGTTPTAAVDDSRKDHDYLPTRRFHRTDTGNAEYFTERHGHMVRYDQRRHRWLLWKTHRWCPDEDAEIRRLAKESVRDRLRMAAAAGGETTEKEEVKWAMQSESRSRLDALLALAQSEIPITDSGNNWDPDPMVLCVPNGVIDLRTGLLRAGCREDKITMSAKVSFDANTSCPRWERFIEEIFGGDRGLGKFIQRAIGYSLTGDTTEQCWFLCYGTGANGKSTLVNTLKCLLDDYAWTVPFSTIEMQQRASIPNDMAALVGRRFVLASETNDGTRLNEARIKMLTGCDQVSARFLHQEFFEFFSVSKLWLCVNHKPIIRDDSDAFWRRMRLIPFLQRFPINKMLSKELLTEGPGILAWAVRGCLEWQQLKGLSPPQIVTVATSTYAHDSDPLNEFLEEACKLDSTRETSAQYFYNAYRHWAMQQGLTYEEWLSGTAFGRKMKTRFQTRRTRAGTFYLGVEPHAM